jgi:molecular chaperone GrpE
MPLVAARRLVVYVAPEAMTDKDNEIGRENIQEGPTPENDTMGGGEMLSDEGTAPGENLSAEEVENLKAKAAKADENWEKYVRVVADFDNYKKRAARERTDAVKYANESLLEKILPVIDNFEAALAAANNAGGSNVDSLKQGVSMIHTQLKGVLGESGLEEVDAMNKPFDPNLHEAVSQQPVEDVPEGQVVQQLRKGYKLKDRLIRPAMVVVSKKP